MQGTNTAAIGDPRNDENLIIVQFHHAMLRFHNAVVDLLVAVAFAGDIFAETKRIVTHHYQWAVVHDFLERICGVAAVNNAMASVSAPVGSPFRMPVEFAVAAYRFGHSMIRDTYWVNFNFPNATLGQVFEFNRNPRLPVFSNWVVDFNAFFDTGVPVPVHNKARKIDSFMANGLEIVARILRIDGDFGNAKPPARSSSRSAERTGHGQFIRHRAYDRGAVDIWVAGGRSGCAEFRRRFTAEQDASVVLRPSRGCGPRRRKSIGSGRRQDRGGDVCQDFEAGCIILSERRRRVRAYSSFVHAWKLHGGRSGRLRRGNATIEIAL